MQMVLLSVIMLGWLLEVLINKKVLIILRLLVMSLSKPLFGWFSQLRFHVVERLIKLIYIMSFQWDT